MQQGSFYKKHGAWHVVYRITEIGSNGVPVRKQKTKRLGAVENGERTPPDHLLVKAQELLAPVNLGSAAPEGAITVSDFAKQYFLPTIEARKKPSTTKFYRDLVKNHIGPLIGNLRLHQVTTRDVQRMLDARRNLSQQSCLRIKTGASAILSTAIRMGYLNGPNAAREARAEGKRTDPDQYAYTLAEVLAIMKKLPEPAKSVVATAAFSGLRESEIRGLQWEDYDGEYLQVRRAVWRTHVGDTKTPESRNAVPVIEPLRKVLDAHRRRNGAGKWIFSGTKMGRPLHLDNLSRRVIRPAVGELWHGWHAFRSGVATVLYDLGVPVESASLILRHANADVTREHYLMLQSRKQGRAAMRRFGSKVRRMLDAKNRRSRSTPRQ